MLLQTAGHNNWPQRISYLDTRRRLPYEPRPIQSHGMSARPHLPQLFHITTFPLNRSTSPSDLDRREYSEGNMSATSAPSGSSGAKASNGPGRQGRKRPRLQPTAKRSTSPVIEISSDDEQISVALYQKRSTVSRTAIEGDPQPLGSSTTAHVREVFEAACEANVALRQEHQREVKRLENDLRTAAEKVATLQREVSAATSSEKESQRERDAVYDTLAALQQELEAAHVAYDQAAEELRVAEDKGARIEEELRHAHSVRRRFLRLVIFSYGLHFSRRLVTYRSKSPTSTNIL